MVEAAGVEPASENASERTSTRVGTPIEVSRPPAAAGLRARRADYVSTSMRQRVRRSSLIVSVLLSYRRKLREPSLPYELGSESNSVIVRSCRFAPFYVAMGATTRSSNVIILVETGTPPCKRTEHTMGLDRRTVKAAGF